MDKRYYSQLKDDSVRNIPVVLDIKVISKSPSLCNIQCPYMKKEEPGWCKMFGKLNQESEGAYYRDMSCIMITAYSSKL